MPRVFTATAAYTAALGDWGTAVLPWSYVANAVLSPLMTFFVLRLQARWSLARASTAILAFLILVLLALWTGIRLFDLRAASAALLVWVEAEWVLVSIAFWTLVQQRFDLISSKRYYGIIQAGESLAIVVGGLVTPLLTRFISPADLLLVSALGLTMSVLFARDEQRHEPPRPETTGDETLPEAPLSGRARRFVLRFAAMMATACIVYYLVDIQFFTALDVTFPDSERLAGFLGLFYAVSGASTLVLNLFGARLLLERLGLFGGLLIRPMLVTGLLALLFPVLLGSGFGPLALVLVCLAKLVEEAICEGIYAPSQKALYQSLPAHLRARIQSLGEGVVEPAGAAAAGILIMLLQYIGGERTLLLAPVALLFCLVWLLVIGDLRHRMRELLTGSLERMRLSSGTPDHRALPGGDLAGLVTSGLELQRLASLMAADPACASLHAALASAADVKRRQIWRELRHLTPTPEIADDACHHWAGHDRDKRAWALELVQHHLPPALRPRVLTLLEGAAHEHIRAPDPAALRTLVRDLATSGGPDSSDWLRACALDCATHRGDPEVAPLLREGLQSPSPAVRETSRRGLAESGTEWAMPPIATVEALRSSPMLAELPDEILAQVAERAVLVTLAPGEILMREGEIGTTMFVVVDGALDVTKDGHVLAVRAAGQILGELAVLDPKPRSATVTAREPCRLLRLGNDTVEAMILAEPEFYRAIVRFLCDRIRATPMGG